MKKFDISLLIFFLKELVMWEDPEAGRIGGIIIHSLSQIKILDLNRQKF